MKFRRAYWAAAAHHVGVEGRFESARLPRDILAGVSTTDRDALVQALVAGLRELRSPSVSSDAFRTIIIDLDPPMIKHRVPISLDTALAGSPAGDALSGMRAHHEALRAKHEQLRAYESPKAVEERKRAALEQRGAEQACRQSEKLCRDMLRMELLETLARLSPAERLSRFASDPELILDSLPAELTAIRDTDLAGLTKAQATALISRIGRRRGAWGRLRRRLEHWLEGQSR